MSRYSAVKKKTANVEKDVQNATMFAVLNSGRRRYRRSSSGCAARRSRQTNAASPTALAHSSAITSADRNPADSELMIANTNAAKVPAPRNVPAVSTRAAVGSALSGRMSAAMIRTVRPNTRLNQKMPRQLHSPIRMPPTIGPAASARPDVPAQMPIALFLALASGYRWRSIDRVPGSLAAAPMPITARPAMRTWTLGASADRTEPAQNVAAPASMTSFLPTSSPIIPHASMRLAKVSAYAPTTHCSSAGLAPRLVYTLPRATLTMVLSRNVRNSSVHRMASASGVPAPDSVPSPRPPETASRLLASLALPGRFNPRSFLGPATRGRQRLAGRQLEQAAEAGVADLPRPALQHRLAGLVGQQRRRARRDVVLDRGRGGGGHRHAGDLGSQSLGGELVELAHRRGERAAVLQQRGLRRDGRAGAEELLPVRGDLRHGARAARRGRRGRRRGGSGRRGGGRGSRRGRRGRAGAAAGDGHRAQRQPQGGDHEYAAGQDMESHDTPPLSQLHVCRRGGWHSERILSATPKSAPNVWRNAPVCSRLADVCVR